jgi:predicted small lipoprotein YifL
MHRTFVIILAAIAIAGCGSKPPPAAPKTEPPPVDYDKQMGTWGELGVLDEGKVRSTFESLWRGDMEACRKHSNEFVAGDFTVRLRINHQGGVKWAYLKSSTLGDRNVEKCILDVVRKATWPAPQGGDDGIAEQELSFAELADRPALAWDTDNFRKTLSDATSKLSGCKGGPYTATVIVKTDGSVLSAGATGPDESSEDGVDCVVEVLRGLKFPKPGSWPAKATFEIQ